MSYSGAIRKRDYIRYWLSLPPSIVGGLFFGLSEWVKGEDNLADTFEVEMKKRRAEFRLNYEYIRKEHAAMTQRELPSYIVFTKQMASEKWYAGFASDDFETIKAWASHYLDTHADYEARIMYVVDRQVYGPTTVSKVDWRVI